MDYPKLYSGRKLVEHGVTKAENGFPARGSKEVIPTGTWLEQKQIQKGLEDKKSMLCERIEKWGSLSHAEWVPEKRLARYTERKGSYMQFFGFPGSDSYYLYPEEALHLMEVNCLMVKYNGVTVSIQQAYSLLLDENITLEEYRVYSHLCRKGYKLLRFKTSKKQNLSSYEKALNVQSLSKSKEFYKRVYSHSPIADTSPSDPKSVDGSGSGDVEMRDWRALPLAIVGEVVQPEKQESPIKRRKVANRMSESSDMDCDNVDSNVINIDDNVINIDDGNNIAVEGNKGIDDCKSKDDVNDMDIDCVPVDTEPSVTIPNAYRREVILIITPNKKLLPPNIKPLNKTYKIHLNTLANKSPVKRNNFSYNHRNFQNCSKSFDRGPRRQFINRSYSNFANHMFRHILQRQAYMANFWPPTFRHNCAPNRAFGQNSRSLIVPFLHSPHVALYPQTPDNFNSFQNPLNNFINNINMQYANNQPAIHANVDPSALNQNPDNPRDPRSHCYKQLQQIKTLISKFDLLRTTPAVGESTLENVKNAIDNLLVTFNASYDQNHTVDSLRISESSMRPQVVNLSSDSEDDCNIGNGLNSNPKRKRRRNGIEPKNKCNNNNNAEETDINNGGETNGTVDNNWLTSNNTWAANKSFVGNTRHSTFLYSEYLLGFMRKSKSSFSINSWKAAKEAFEESLQKNTVCISDDDDEQEEIRPKKVLLSLKIDKIQPLIRPQDCSSISTILQRLSIIKKANVGRSMELRGDDSTNLYRICFDVYSSNAKNVKKENLTKPIFRVVCIRVADPLPSLATMTELLQCCNDDAPLKWAVVGLSSITYLQFANVDLPLLCRDPSLND